MSTQHIDSLLLSYQRYFNFHNLLKNDFLVCLAVRCSSWSIIQMFVKNISQFLLFDNVDVHNIVAVIK